jgi:hypothetical protein
LDFSQFCRAGSGIWILSFVSRWTTSIIEWIRGFSQNTMNYSQHALLRYSITFSRTSTYLWHEASQPTNSRGAAHSIDEDMSIVCRF